MTTEETPTEEAPSRVPPGIKLSDNVDVLVNQFVATRDRIAKEDEAHKIRMSKARGLLQALNDHLTTRLRAVGGDSVKTPNGTAYLTTKKTATIADPAAFRAYVLENERYDLVDWKANAPAVNDHIDTETVPPPGVNYSTRVTVGVRRAAGK